MTLSRGRRAACQIRLPPGVAWGTTIPNPHICRRQTTTVSSACCSLGVVATAGKYPGKHRYKIAVGVCRKDVQRKSKSLNCPPMFAHVVTKDTTAVAAEV